MESQVYTRPMFQYLNIKTRQHMYKSHICMEKMIDTKNIGRV